MAGLWPCIALVVVNLGVIAGATGATSACRAEAAAALIMDLAEEASVAGTYTACGNKRAHHASSRRQTTRISWRTGLVGACMVAADLLTVTALFALLPWRLPVGDVATPTLHTGGVDDATGCGAALLTTGSALPLQPEPKHLRAGISFGTGGGFEAAKGSRGGGIVGGGTALA